MNGQPGPPFLRILVFGVFGLVLINFCAIFLMKLYNRNLLHYYFYLKFGMNVGIRVTNSIREKKSLTW